MVADIVRGTLTILIIMIVSGVIAYVGDRVGHQVGRKRLTLFGIRPRYTSTIVAVGTGMIIALLAILVAIIVSQQVKTALFRMNQISLQITQLQAQKNDLESKVNTGQLVVRVDSLMVPFFKKIVKGTAEDQRLKQMTDFYHQSVQWMNANYTQLGLRKFTPPTDFEKKLNDIAGQPSVTVAGLNNDLLVYVTADQNLYRNDEIHFQLNLIADSKRMGKGQNIAYLVIPGGHNADVNLAVGELVQIVSNVASRYGGLPPFFATNTRVVQTFPDVGAMQLALNKGSGNYALTAFAAEDIYPHTGGVPIVVTLTKTK
ncbi:MAG: DUF3084 domain-containing protein [Candidatus Eremiobacteraeota bacterium]|nr:DUF3084 domain-containing protein [Candidatus Eremiobacteraeota bacterium]